MKAARYNNARLFIADNEGKNTCFFFELRLNRLMFPDPAGDFLFIETPEFTHFITGKNPLPGHIVNIIRTGIKHYRHVNAANFPI
jgi:hypothetical protein